VAIAEVHGPRAGIEAIEAVQNNQQLESYYLLYAVLAEFESRLNDLLASAGHLRKALQLAGVKSERLFLLSRLRNCEAGRVEAFDASSN
jgi:RNA polymerase sigma-70 factor (ECF subfamily)